MRKRILSLLLALTLALSAGVFGVIPALAADSCVSVKADAHIFSMYAYRIEAFYCL